MQVTDLLLCDRGKWVDRVKPSVEGWLLNKLLEACVLKITRILDSIDLLDELSPLRQDILMVAAKIIDILVEVIQHGVTLRFERCVSQGSKRSKQEVPCMEARSDNDTI